MPKPNEYAELWICMNCRNIDVLNQHGRCTTCDSDAVAAADVGRSRACAEIEELERLYRAPASTQSQEMAA
jgi:hypothetical protein